ncbi:MAG: hypothetical protein ACREQJ_06980 [Candidatus Binatia bacterium]
MARRDGAEATKRPAARWKIEAMLEELRNLAVRLGYQVREEKLHREVGYRVRSGACRVREKNLILIDRELAPAARVEVLVDELSRRELGDVYVSPEVRRLLGKEERVGA